MGIPVENPHPAKRRRDGPPADERIAAQVKRDAESQVIPEMT